MAFSDKDQTIETEVEERFLSYRVERNDGYPEDEPDADIYVVKQINGQIVTLRVSRAAVIANYAVAHMTLEDWGSAIYDTAE